MAVAFSMAWAEARAGARNEADQGWERLAGFRGELYRCFTARADALRDPAAADRWTWLIPACYAQLWLARGLAADLRPPWQRPACPAA